MLKRFKTKELNKAATPMPTKFHLELNPNGKDVVQKVYRSMIGSLLYLYASRTDMVLSVGVCAMYQANPKEIHLVLEGFRVARTRVPHEGPKGIKHRG
jgi:hypothetical protein